MAKKKDLKELESAVAAAPAEEQYEFDAWYALREKKIPKHHYKEIIKADFKDRGLGAREGIKTFDAALEKYGLKLS